MKKLVIRYMFTSVAITTLLSLGVSHAESYETETARNTLLETYVKARESGNDLLSQSTTELSDWTSFLQMLEDIPIVDVDEQVIEPKKATEAITSTNISPEAQIWKEKVDAWRTAQSNAGGLTCDAAIGSLKLLACTEDVPCKLEDNYKAQCLDTDISTKEAMDCVSAVDNYLSACFKSSDTQFPSLQDYSIGGTTERPLCNVATFEHNCHVTFATAGHCIESGDSLLSTYNTYSRDDTREFERRDDGPFAAGDDFAFLKLVDSDANDIASKRPLLQTKQAIPFDPTVFAANNGFLLLRNEVIEKHGLEQRGYTTKSLFASDRSPLCTVAFSTDDGVQRHTCQTSSGSSGGALIQRSDTYFAVVGINRGRATTQNSIANASSFAPTPAFHDSDGESCDALSLEYAQ